VDNATRRIRDGQRIRLHATEGYIEILDKKRSSLVHAACSSSAGSQGRR
jgi:hypothetical protein